MSWDLTHSLRVDISDQGSTLIEVNANGVADRQRELIWRAGDNFDLILFLHDRTATDPTVPVALPANRYILLGAKLSTNGVISGNALFGADSFVEVTVGTETGYQCAIPLDDSGLATAISGKASITVQVDLEFENADNSRRLTKSFDVTIKPESFADSFTPVPATPVYPAPSALVTTADVASGIVLTKGEGGELIITVDGIERARI
jgi:hypothetical protein